MTEWKELRLGDICKTNQNSYSSSDRWDFVNYLDTGNITENKISEIQLIDLEKEDLPSRAKRKVSKNSIIYSTVRPNQKHFGIIKTQPENFLVSTGFAVIDVDTRIADPDFIFYNLIQNENTESLHAIAEQTTSAYPAIKPSDIENLPITLPSLPIQKKIATILSSIDDKIKLNNKINDNLEQQAQAIFKSWFVDFEPFGGNLPEDWRLGTLADIADYYNGYAFSSKELLNEPTDDCLDVFKQGHIKKGGGFNSEGTKSWYPLSKCKNLQNYILKKGDILMAMTDMKGNVAILGNTSIMPVDDKYIVNQRVGLLRAKKDLNIDYPYLYLLTNEHNFLMDLRSRANSGVQVNLSSSAIKESEINIAPKEIYSKFNNIVLPLFEQTLANQLENQKLASLRDNLLPKLMSGELDVDSVQI